MSKLFFTADLHFGHKNIIEYCDRPYKSVDEMNDALVNNWNKVVGIDDDILVLGDFSLSFDMVQIITPLLAGKKYLVPGNHDWCSSLNSRSKTEPKRLEWIKKYEDCGWNVCDEYIQAFLEIDQFPENFIVPLYDYDINIKRHYWKPDSDTLSTHYYMCHLPFIGDTQDTPRYDRIRPKDFGQWLLHGHVHCAWKKKNNMVNVGVDMWNYAPVSKDQIFELMCNKESII